jgi:hypothetical protein
MRFKDCGSCRKGALLTLGKRRDAGGVDNIELRHGVNPGEYSYGDLVEGINEKENYMDGDQRITPSNILMKFKDGGFLYMCSLFSVGINNG